MHSSALPDWSADALAMLPLFGAIVPRRIGPAISETHARGPIANLTKLHTNLKVALLCPVPPAADSGSHFDPHCTRAIGLVQTTADGFESCERHDDDADTKVRTSADRELEEASAVHRRSREQAGSALSKYPPGEAHSNPSRRAQ
jgi:hypothetical protein